MGGGRDYKKVAYIRYKRDADGNPVYMDNGQIATERAYKYVRITEYKRKQNALETVQKQARSAMASRMASRMAARNQQGGNDLSERVRHAQDVINQATDKKSLQAAMESLGLGDKASFVKELKNFEGAKEIALAMAEMNETFGSDLLENITTKGSFGSGVGGYRVVGKNVLHMNSNWFNDPEGTQKILDRAVENGHFAKGENLQSLVKHEYGHLLQDKLTKEVRDSSIFKTNEEKMEQRRKDFFDSIAKVPENDRKKISDYFEKAFTADTDKSIRTNITKALKLVREHDLHGNADYYKTFDAINNYTILMSKRNMMLHNAETNGIKNVFNSIGITSPLEVSHALTGGNRAYAKMSWAESHAEMISDYMTNGPDGASATSILYVQAFAKEIGVKL